MKYLLKTFTFLIFITSGMVYSQEYHTIYEIQGQSSSSPFEGQVVSTRGIVTAVFNEGFFIEERPGGPWMGIYVYTSSTPSVARGDSVKVTGEIVEYYNTTEFSFPDNITVLASGLKLPEPVDTTTLELGQEKYEGVYSLVRNVIVTDTSDFGQYDEWFVDDGSGELMIDYSMMIDVQGGYEYQPSPGDSITEIKGIAHFSYYNYKLVPREDADIQLIPVKTELILSPERTFRAEEIQPQLFINFPEPENENLKALKISIESTLGWDLTDINIFGAGTESAIIDISDTLISIDSLDVSDSLTIDFNRQTMPDFVDEFTFSVEASFDGNKFFIVKPEPTIETLDRPDEIYNISTVQGDGYESPLEGSSIFIIGTVTTPNFSLDGYSSYIQDSTGGINIFSYDPLGIEYGYRYLIFGEIEEYNGLTEIIPDPSGIILFSRRNNPVEIDTLRVSMGLSEEKEGKLITIEDAIVIEPPTVPAGGGYNSSIRNGQTALPLRIMVSTGIVDSISLIKNSRWDITGIVGQYDTDEPYTSGYQLLPRFISDFKLEEVSGDTTEVDLTILPNPFAPDQGEVIWITVSAPLNYTINGWIFDAKGREITQIITNHPGPIKKDWLGYDDMNRRVDIGTYILHIEAKSPEGKISYINKPIVVASELGGN
jgi:hypothetical protein